MPKQDPVKELYSQLQQVRMNPDNSKRPNKWKELWMKDVGSMLTRYNVVSRKLAKAESQIKLLTE